MDDEKMKYMHKKKYTGIDKVDKYLNDMSENSKSAYIQTIHKYEGYHNMTFKELVDEALTEQTAKTPEHELSIYDRIEDFKEWEMYEYKYNTIKSDLTKIKNLYKRCRVRLPFFPPLEVKHCKTSPFIEYNEILSKKEIKNALPFFKSNFQARIMTMATGGYSLEETSQMTLEQFYEDLKPHHKQDNIEDAMKILAQKDNVVWVTKMIRQKTKKPYYGMVNPETTQKIAESWVGVDIENYRRVKKHKLLKIQKKKNWDETYIPLFLQNKQYVSQKMGEINDNLNYGMAGDRRRFTPHSLRRFNATYLTNADLSYEEEMQVNMIDELQGRSLTSTQDRYIKTNPVKQKLLYVKVMNNVSLFNQYTYEIYDSDVIVHRVDPNKKLKKVEEENKNLRKKVDDYENGQTELEKYIESIGKDKFHEQLSKLLNES